jgi:hypothetical protein
MLTLESGSSCDVCMDDFGPRKLPHCIPCGQPSLYPTLEKLSLNLPHPLSGHVLCLSCCNNILDNTTSRLAPVCPFCRQEFFRGAIRLIRIDFKRVSPPAQANRRKISNGKFLTISSCVLLSPLYSESIEY